MADNQMRLSLNAYTDGIATILDTLHEHKQQKASEQALIQASRATHQRAISEANMAASHAAAFDKQNTANEFLQLDVVAQRAQGLAEGIALARSLSLPPAPAAVTNALVKGGALAMINGAQSTLSDATLLKDGASAALDRLRAAAISIVKAISIAERACVDYCTEMNANAKKHSEMANRWKKNGQPRLKGIAIFLAIGLISWPLCYNVPVIDHIYTLLSPSVWIIRIFDLGSQIYRFQMDHNLPRYSFPLMIYLADPVIVYFLVRLICFRIYWRNAQAVKRFQVLYSRALDLMSDKVRSHMAPQSDQNKFALTISSERLVNQSGINGIAHTWARSQGL